MQLALGAMYFGTRVADREAFAILDRYVDGGGTLIDTANCYAFWDSPTGHGGQSEELIGRWLARRPGMADRVVLSTKVGAEPTVVGDWPASAEGLSRKVILSGIEGSLKRMGTDHVGVLWAHMDDRKTPQAETVEAFAEVVGRGYATEVGCSNFPMWRVERARGIAAAAGIPGFSALQLRHSYVRPRPGVQAPEHDHLFGSVTEETLDYVETEGLALWAYTPLLRGSYDRPDRPMLEPFQHPGTERRLAALASVSAELGVTNTQVVLAWLAGGRPPVTSIVGVSTPEQVDAALAGVRLELSAEHRQRLDSAG